MKPTDYSPRAAFMDTKLPPDATGVEVGCDVGSHAQSLLEYRHVKFLYLIDLFTNEWCEGYCNGRLSRWANRVWVFKGASNELAKNRVFQDGLFDFVYIDISHDAYNVGQSLNDWWPLIKPGGVMGYRNYSTCKAAIDPWLVGKKFEVDGYHNEVVIYKP